VPGNGVTVTVQVSGQPDSSVPLVDLVNCGAALCGAWRLPAGQEIELDLPDGRGAVPGRVVRCEGEVLAMVFRQDGATAGRVARAIEFLGRHRTAA
jgi:hypothetical protein